jgi:hypothetical protein
MDDELLLYDFDLPITQEDADNVKVLLYLLFLFKQESPVRFYFINAVIDSFIKNKEKLKMTYSI